MDAAAVYVKNNVVTVKLIFMNHAKSLSLTNNKKRDIAVPLKSRIKLLFALLVCNSAGCLTSRLAGSLALAAAALFSGLLKVSLVNGNDMLHDKLLLYKKSLSKL